MNVTVSAEEQLGCVDDFVRAELKIEVEAPQSLEELLNDPLFVIADNASEKDVFTAVDLLLRKYALLEVKLVMRPDLLERINSSDNETRAQAKEEKKQIELGRNERQEKFKIKLYETFGSIFKSIIDDERAYSGDPALNIATYLSLLSLRNFDELVEIRAQELKRCRQIVQSFENETAVRRAIDRLWDIDLSLFQFYSR